MGATRNPLRGVPFLVVVVALLALLPAAASAAPPANDDFANAAVLSGSSDSASGTNVEATKETGEPDHAGSSGGASVWYRWQAPATGQVSVDTCNSDFDTLLAVYTGSAVNALSEVASSDDDCSLQSSVSFIASAGTTYRIAVDGFSGATGNVELDLDVQPAPVNDNFANAVVLSGSSDSASGTNSGATKETGEPNHADRSGGVSVWYRWQAPATGQVSVDTCNSDFDTLLAVYTGSAVNTLSEVASNDDALDCSPQSAVSFSASAGTTYRIAVDGFSGATGTVQLDLEPDSSPPNGPGDDFFADVVATGSSKALTECRNARQKVKKAKKGVKKAKKRLRKADGKKAEKKAKKTLKKKKKKLKKKKKAKKRACENHPPKFDDAFVRGIRQEFGYIGTFLISSTVSIKLTPASDRDGDRLTYGWAVEKQGSICAYTIPWDCPKSSSRLPAARLSLLADGGVLEDPGDVTVTVTDGRGGEDTAVITSAPL
jgi:hypothetical protein